MAVIWPVTNSTEKQFSLNRGASRKQFPIRNFIRCLVLIVLAGLPLRQASAADGFIWLNVSVKMIVDPATGQIPTTNSDALLNESFGLMNRWLANTWRGYRVRAADLDTSGNFKRIGSLNDTTGPGKWYAIDLKYNVTNRQQFVTQAQANKTQFGWNDYAINIYINNGDYSSEGEGFIISAYNLLLDDLVKGRSGAFGYQVAGNLLHEIGHFMGLGHTFPDDGFTDTAPDPNTAPGRNETAIRNSIALTNWSMNYSSLTTDRKILVDNTANNAMSYYQLFYDDPAQSKVLTDAERYGPTRFVITERQMDWWTDYANGNNSNVTTGVTKFVDAAAASGGNGTSAAPFNTLAAGVTAVTGGADIVLLRPGTYSATTLTKPLTIRVSRPGAAVIIRP